MKLEGEKSDIGIEEYSRLLPQYYGMDIPVTLKKYLDAAPFTSLLDCGCGDGALLYALKQNNYFKNRKISAIDLSKNRIDLVKKIDPNIHAFVDSAETLKKIKSGTLDFLMSKHVIEHVDDKKMLNAIQRVMKKNGIIYIATIFKKPWGWYYHRKDGKWTMDVTHLREYTEDKELLDLIDKQIFKILEIKKTQLFFPIIDFFIRRLYIHGLIKNRKLFIKNGLFTLLQKIIIPIPGYYNWDIVLKKL